MVKILLLAVITIALTLQQSEAVLQCHNCRDACEASKSTNKPCGQNIGPSHDAFCTTEVLKGSKTPSVAIRKCEITTKGSEPPCPENSVCTSCKSDLCNAAPSTSSSMAMVGVVTAFFAAKFVLN